MEDEPKSKIHHLGDEIDCDIVIVAKRPKMIALAGVQLGVPH